MPSVKSHACHPLLFIFSACLFMEPFVPPTPHSPSSIFGSRSQSLIHHSDMIHMISCLILCQKSTPLKWPFYVQSSCLPLIITAYLVGSHKVRISCILIIRLFIHNTCMCKKIAIPALEEVQEALVRSLLLSPVCHYHSRGFPLCKAVLIADGVVLAKYLVTVLKGWKMWEWRSVREGHKNLSFCFVLPHALWVHKWSLYAFSLSC